MLEILDTIARAGAADPTTTGIAIAFIVTTAAGMIGLIVYAVADWRSSPAAARRRWRREEKRRTARRAAMRKASVRRLAR